jgi:hypothetical protein
MRRGVIFMAMAGLALAACTNEPGAPAATGATAAAPAAPAGFQCPPPGTAITYADGRQVTFTGADPADPFVCLATDGGTGVTHRRLGNWFVVPMHDEANVRRGFAQLWPLNPGSSTSFARDLVTPDGRFIGISESWRVIGPRTMTIAGSPRQVLVIENTTATQLRGYSGTWTYFVDTAARTAVGGDLTVQQGINRAQNWRATAISVPGG